MTDVIEQARKVARLYSDVSAAYIALMAVVEAADAGYLIDARRLEALTGTWGVSLDYQHVPEPDWGVVRFDERSRETVYESGRTAGEALAAAEREAE